MGRKQRRGGDAEMIKVLILALLFILILSGKGEAPPST